MKSISNQTCITSFSLTPFEHYLYADDTPCYPMSCFLQLKFEGIFLRAEFIKALYFAIQEHPLFGSTINGDRADKTKNLKWIYHPDKMPYVSWENVTCPINYPFDAMLDLKKEIGLRFWIREDANTTLLLIQNHHSITDGVGNIQFLQTFLHAYHHYFNSNHSIQNSSIDPHEFNNRNQFKNEWKACFAQLYYGIFSVIRFFKNPPINISTPTSKSLESNLKFPIPSPLQSSFPIQDLSRLIQLAKQSEVTLNDLLLMCLFNTLKKWILQFDSDSTKQPIRITVPMNLRQKAHLQLPATNIVSMVFLSRELKEINSSLEFLLKLNQEMNLKKRWRLSLIFLKILQFAGCFKGGMQKILNPSKCRSSAVLSNMGIVLNNPNLPMSSKDQVISGNVKLNDIIIMGPLRHQTPINFVSYTYAQTFYISLNYDSRLFKQDEANQLLNLFIEEINQINSIRSNI